MASIISLNPSHCSQVACLHLDNLPTHFSGKPGLALLGIYYRSLSLGRGAVGFVAEDQGRVLGFVCGIFDPVCFQQTINKSFLPLIFWGSLQAFIRPALLGDLVKRVFDSSSSRPGFSSGYELRPIVIVPEARGSGIAGLLLSSLLADARSRGYERIFLFTEADNLVAIRFYLRHGFQFVEQMVHDDQCYHRYERLAASNES